MLVLECTGPLGIKTEAQLNNPPQTKFKSNPSRPSENVSTGLGFFFLLVLNSFVLPNLGQDQKLKYSKAPDNIFIVYSFDPSRW